MRQYYKFDENGYYLEPVIAQYNEQNSMPPNVTDIRPPDGLYRGRYDGVKWEETITPEELEATQLKQESTETQATTEERLKAIEVALLEMAGEIYG